MHACMLQSGGSGGTTAHPPTRPPTHRLNCSRWASTVLSANCAAFLRSCRGVSERRSSSFIDCTPQ